MPDDASGWRPIESAPKDGTRIVLAEYEPGGIFHEDARWRFWMDYWRKYPVFGRKWDQLSAERDRQIEMGLNLDGLRESASLFHEPSGIWANPG